MEAEFSVPSSLGPSGNFFGSVPASASELKEKSSDAEQRKYAAANSDQDDNGLDVESLEVDVHEKKAVNCVSARKRKASHDDSIRADTDNERSLNSACLALQYSQIDQQINERDAKTLRLEAEASPNGAIDFAIPDRSDVIDSEIGKLNAHNDDVRSAGKVVELNDAGERKLEKEMYDKEDSLDTTYSTEQPVMTTHANRASLEKVIHSPSMSPIAAI